MFDVVVIAGADSEAAARSVATLVEGVVDGMLRRAVLLSPVESDGLRQLADAAGCRLVAGVASSGFGEALKAELETPHVLALAAGALLPAGWPELLRQELQRRGAPPVDAALAFRPSALAPRLALRAAIAGKRPAPVTYGVLAPRSALIGHDFDGRTVAARTRVAAGLTVERAGGW